MSESIKYLFMYTTVKSSCCPAVHIAGPLEWAAFFISMFTVATFPVLKVI